MPTSTSLTRRLTVFIAFVFALTATTQPAGAQYDGTPSLTCRPTSVAAGGTVDCEATGYRDGADVTFKLLDVSVAARAGGADGRAKATLTVPGTSPDGPTTITATGPAANDGSPLELRTELTVTAAPTTTGTETDGTATDGTVTSDTAPVTSGFTGSDGTLAPTGTNSGSSTPWIVLAVVLIVAAGAVALVVTRRRAAATSAGDEIEIVDPSDDE